jgi:hypothetical protein
MEDEGEGRTGIGEGGMRGWMEGGGERGEDSNFF